MDAKNANRPELDALSKRIIGCAWTVARQLGAGFLEKVYENALAHELRKVGLAVSQQHNLSVIYDGITEGDYFADMLVQDSVLIELKVAPALHNAHRAQCLNYLRATGLHLCLLMSFGAPRLKIRRIVLDF
jgi:GxxExxY protein